MLSFGLLLLFVFEDGGVETREKVGTAQVCSTWTAVLSRATVPESFTERQFPIANGHATGVSLTLTTQSEERDSHPANQTTDQINNQPIRMSGYPQ